MKTKYEASVSYGAVISGVALFSFFVGFVVGVPHDGPWDVKE